MRIVLLLIWLLAAPGLTQEIIDVTFRTRPGGVTVYRVKSSGLELLGTSDEPVPMTYPGSSFEVRLEKWGYRARQLTVNLQEAERQGRSGYFYPREEPLELEPEYALRPLLEPLPLAVAGAVLFLGTGAGFWVRRQRLAIRKEHREAADFQARVVPSKDDMVGNWLGDYYLLEKLGRGGMAVVYRVARRNRSDDEYALKLLNEDCCEDDEFIERFRREVKICRSLQHPAVVQLYDFDVWNGRYYTVMELMEGHTLREELRHEGLPAEQALKLLKPVFDGVAFAHSQGVVHRDLKPENVLVGKSIKVADFGLARRENSTTITRTGSVFGTPAYMSPEQISEGPMGPAVDQYALGVMAFEVLAGRPPFLSQNNPVETIMKHLTEPPPPVTQFRDDLPPAVAEVLDRMLSKEPEARYPSVTMAFQALEEALG